MTDPFTFNPLHIRCDEIIKGSGTFGGGGGSGGVRFTSYTAVDVVWHYPLPNGERLEAEIPAMAFGVGGGAWNSAPRTGYKPDFLTDHRLLALQEMHAAWVAGLSAHQRLAIAAAAQREGGE